MLLLAASRDQAAIAYRYVLGFLESSPILRQQVESVTAAKYRLINGITIAAQTSRVGRDIIDHGRCGSDDYANACFGCLYLLKAPAYDASQRWGQGFAELALTFPGRRRVWPFA